MKNVIIQAGGKGTRLGKLTKNKPKALVSVNAKPLIFYNIEKFKNSRIFIIMDYKDKIFRDYLNTFVDKGISYETIVTRNSGTVAGIGEALELIPDNEKILLLWSDLIVDDEISIFNLEQDTLFFSGRFECRWSYKNSKFIEESSTNYGVSGVFFFNNKSALKNIPKEGEFVRWLSKELFQFKTITLQNTKEIGTLEQLELNKRTIRHRSFNQVLIKNGYLIKTPIGSYGTELNLKEVVWYSTFYNELNFFLPEIVSYQPLTMKFYPNENFYRKNSESQIKFFIKITEFIQLLHSRGSIVSNQEAILDVNYLKPISRFSLVSHLVPFSNDEIIFINGKKVINPLFYLDEIKTSLENLEINPFVTIHGDLTISNILFLNDESMIKVIDPRGFFGGHDIYGDGRYDWAKLYYSLFGNYENFSDGKFNVIINEKSIEIAIDKNKIHFDEKYFFQFCNYDPNEIRLMHGLIWLSLTSYVWYDYDSICCSFYNSCLLLGEHFGKIL